MKKKKRVQPFDYLKNHVKFYLKRSNTHGVGLFALVDIKEGEELTSYYRPDERDWELNEN